MIGSGEIADAGVMHIKHHQAGRRMREPILEFVADPEFQDPLADRWRCEATANDEYMVARGQNSKDIAAD